MNKVLLENKIQICVEELKGLGISDVQTMKLIYSHPDYKIKQYLNVIKVPKSTFTNIVNRLVKKGLVSRTIEKRDLRSFGLELTDTGRKAVENHMKAEEDKIRELLMRLEPDEQEMFFQLLKKMME